MVEKWQLRKSGVIKWLFSTCWQENGSGWPCFCYYNLLAQPPSH